MDRAEATLGNFFGATKKERLIAYVRHPERVNPLMLDYYSREPFKTSEFLGLKNDLQAAESIGPTSMLRRRTSVTRARRR